jgi:acetyl-CoA acetyltransferase
MHAQQEIREVNNSPYDATPLRAAHRAPLTDGAVAFVVASEKFLKSNPGCRPLARIIGVGWATDSYRLDAQRLRALHSARRAWRDALKHARLMAASDFDVIELESQTGYHEAAYIRALGIENESSISPSGGPFAQNPLFCSGLISSAEAVLQVAGKAGAVQRPNVRRAAAHSCHGYAQQGNVLIVFEAPGAIQ